MEEVKEIHVETIDQAAAIVFGHFMDSARWFSIGCGKDTTIEHAAQYLLYDFSKRLNYHDDKITKPKDFEVPSGNI